MKPKFVLFSKKPDIKDMQKAISKLYNSKFEDIKFVSFDGGNVLGFNIEFSDTSKSPDILYMYYVVEDINKYQIAIERRIRILKKYVTNYIDNNSDYITVVEDDRDN